MPYLALQQVFDQSAPAGALNYWRSAFLGEVSKVDGTTYTVKWDDGSDPSTVEAGKISAE